METVERRAHAKLNLTLAVGPPRAGDGYHPICSWFAPIDLADDLRILRLDGGASRFEFTWADDAPRPSPIDWPVDRDLCVRAHAALEGEARRALPVAMTLRKRIPVGGGLGGGSSDAAAMLVALREMFGLSIDDRGLAALALTLGSDVPYFLLRPPSAAVVEGLGERIVPVDIEPGRFVLIFPPMGCPTGAVYKAFDADLPGRGRPGPLRTDDVWTLARGGRVTNAALFNDLAIAAMHVAPALADVRDRAASATGRPAHVTGSGSTMFVVCENDADQAATRTALSHALPECGVIASRTMAPATS
jgi:4-diphosphocytidyl-2-C-methyl-D-erythritol kinase